MWRTIGPIIVLMLVLLPGSAARTQEASPPAATSLLTELGYPELRVTVTDEGVELPDQVEAGRTLIVYENASSDSLHPLLLRLPDGLAIAEALADLGPEAMEPPGWFFEAHFPGFVGETLPGQTSYAVVDLIAGPHLVLHDSAAALEVVPTDAAGRGSQAPAPAPAVNLFEMGFQLPAALGPGPQVWEVTNIGTVPHELLLVHTAQPVTEAQLIELFRSEDEQATPIGDGSSDEQATPVGGGPSLADIEPMGGVGWLSPGTTAWTEVNLSPGTYAALCFVFDPETGMPHLMQGMVAVFTVGEAATPAAATPVG